MGVRRISMPASSFVPRPDRFHRTASGMVVVEEEHAPYVGLSKVETGAVADRQ